MQEHPMGLTMHERKAITNELSGRYQKATKTAKGQILTQFIQLTGYSHCYASHILHNWGTHHVRIINGKRVEIVLGIKQQKQRRTKPRRYSREIVLILERIWAISDGLCGKRLRAFIDTALPILERYGELVLPDDETRTKLLTISPATIDRLLAPTRKRFWDKGRSATKPGTLLKYHIPIRTYQEWNEKIPGFLEIDLVAHDGGSAFGDFIQSLDVTDIASGWTETRAVRNKAQRWVMQALHAISNELPFPILGIDSDNGGEFINNHLLRFCNDRKISFTRSRPYRKNDSCYIEQKNYTIVRKTVGYYRYDNDLQLTLINEIYSHLRLYSNFFQPVMKLVSKSRIGSKVRKTYDQPQTPFQRLLLHPTVHSDVKEKLSALFGTLNPADLKRTIARLQNNLFLSHSPLPQRPAHLPIPGPLHPWRATDPRCTNLAIPASALDSFKNNPHNPSLQHPAPPE
jgi:hypothetical protein